MPDLDATCSLDLGCPADEFRAFCDAHPDRTVVVYANTSAAVKARADWMVTSCARSTSSRTCRRRARRSCGRPTGTWAATSSEQTGADMLLWNGACIVHDEFKALELEVLKAAPRCQGAGASRVAGDVVAQADVVGSTSRS